MKVHLPNLVVRECCKELHALQTHFLDFSGSHFGMSWGSAHLLLLLIQSLLQLRLLAAELSWDVALEQFQVVLVSISTRVCLATSAGYQMQ